MVEEISKEEKRDWLAENYNGPWEMFIDPCGIYDLIHRYEEALQKISSITKFEVPLEGASAFLFGICSKMRKIAKEALTPSVLESFGNRALPSPVTVIESRIHEADVTGVIIDGGDFKHIIMDDPGCTATPKETKEFIEGILNNRAKPKEGIAAIMSEDSDAKR